MCHHGELSLLNHRRSPIHNHQSMVRYLPFTEQDFEAVLGSHEGNPVTLGRVVHRLGTLADKDKRVIDLTAPSIVPSIVCG